MSRLDELIQQLCPDGVEYKHLGDICAIKGRIGFRGYTRNDQVEEGEGALSLSPTNIQDGRMDYTKGTYITWEKYEESPEIMTYNGDIIFCKTASVGKTALVKDLPYKATINPQLVVLKDIQCNTPFLAYVLETNTIQKKVVSLAGVGSVPNISQKSLSELEIPLPTLPVQEEIVRLLDQLTETTQKYQAELEAELELRKKQYEEYRNQLLDLEGKEGVEMKTLGEIGEFIRGNGIQKTDFIKEGFPCIHYGQIHTKFDLSTNTVISYIDKSLYTRCRKAETDDVILATTSEDVECVAKPLVWLGTEKVAISGDAYIFRHNQNGLFIAHQFMTHNFLLFKKKYATGTKVVRISGDNMAKFEFPLPSLVEQQRIVDILDRMDKAHKELCQSIEEEIKKRKQQYEYYRNQLLDFKKKES